MANLLAVPLVLEPKAKRITTGELPVETIELALAVGVPQVAAKQRRRELLIESIDSEPAATSRWSKPLIAGGARLDYRGLVVRGSVVTAPITEHRGVSIEVVEAPDESERDDADA